MLTMTGLTWFAFIAIFAHGKDGQVTGLMRTHCERSARFESPKKGYALDGNVLATVNAENAVNCVISCLQHPGCKAINFHVSTNDEHVCELNSKTEDDVTLTVNSDVTYYGVPQSQQLNCSHDGPGECQMGGKCVMSCSTDPKLMCQCPAGRTGLTCLDEKVVDKNQGFAMVFPTKSVENYILIQNNPPEMSKLTVLFWMNTLETGKTRLLSYQVEAADELTIGVPHGLLAFYVQSEQLTFRVPSIRDGYWHHVGFTWSLGNYSVYLDGALLSTGDGFGSGVPLKGGGFFYIGQKVDSSGSFDPEKSFHGKLSQLNIWDEILTSGQIKSTSKSCYNNVGTILDWSAVVSKTSGNVIKEEPDSCISLRENPDYDITISANLSKSTQTTHIVASGEIPSLEKLTISMWGKHSEYLRYVQYSSNGATSLSFRLHKDVLILEIAGATIKEARVPMYWKEAPAYWHHIATTWSSATGEWKIFLDGSLVSIMHGVASGITIPAGELSLGLGNTENNDLSMDGSLSRLNIWDYELNGLALAVMANEGPLFENGNVFAWYGVKSKVVGDMIIRATPSDLYNNRADAEYQMNFPEASSSNYALLYDVFPNDITTFSACFWAKITVTGTGIYTYSTPGWDSEITTYFYTTELQFFIRSGNANAPAVTSTNRWYFHCTQWRSSDGLAEVYKDGVIIKSTPGLNVGLVIPSGGAMVLGQELDLYAGGFASYQAMQGYLAGVNFWSDFLTANEVQGMALGVTNVNGNLLQWRDLKGAAFGAVTANEKAYGALPEYRVMKLRDDWCETTHPGTYARFVRNQKSYDWRCVRPSAMLPENMCYDIIGDSSSFFSKTASILSFT